IRSSHRGASAPEAAPSDVAVHRNGQTPPTSPILPVLSATSPKRASTQARGVSVFFTAPPACQRPVSLDFLCDLLPTAWHHSPRYRPPSEPLRGAGGAVLPPVMTRVKLLLSY